MDYKKLLKDVFRVVSGIYASRQTAISELRAIGCYEDEDYVLNTELGDFVFSIEQCDDGMWRVVNVSMYSDDEPILYG